MITQRETVLAGVLSATLGLWVICSPAASAAQASGDPGGSASQSDPAASAAEAQPAASGAQPPQGQATDSADQANGQGTEKDFVPSEEISEDFAVSFPVDI